MVTIQFKEIVEIMSEKKICIYIYNPTRVTPKNFINDKELFNLLLDKYGNYYVDQLDVDSLVVSLVLIKPDDLETYKKSMEDPLAEYE